MRSHWFQFTLFFGALGFITLGPLLFCVFAKKRELSRRFLWAVTIECFGVLGLVLFSNSIVETFRNFFGYLLIGATIGVVSLWRNWRLAENRVSNKAAAGIVSAAAGGAVLFYFFVAVCEDSVSFAFTLMRVPFAKTVSGLRISRVVKLEGGSWTTGDHFWHCLGDSEELIALRLGNLSDEHLFAYNTRTQTIVPLCDRTAAAFPALMPVGDQLVPLEKVAKPAPVNGGTVWSEYQGIELKAPEKWFRASTDAAHRE